MTDIDSSAHDHLTMDRLRTEALDPRNGMSPPDMKPKDKGKSRAFNLGALSFSGTPSSTPPKNNIVEHDPQTNSYLLPLPSSTSGQDTTPTTSFMKSPPRPPARSPLRQSQQPSPRPKTIDPPPLPNEASSGESSKPIPRQGKGGLDAAARAKRREAYKSGMSFVSLYELYSEDVPPVPVPPLPSLDRSKLDTDPAFAKRARSGSTASIGATREGKNSQQSIAPAAIVNHSRARSGSSSASPLKSPGHISRPSRDAAIAITGPQGGDSLRLSNATISSSIPTTPASAPIPTPESGSSKSKRQHVLFEILETERIYSSDMALVRQVHLPLALGMKVDLGPMGSTTGSARSSGAEATQAEASRISGISTNTASSSQSQSGSSGYPVSTSAGYVLANEPPMSVEDTKVIFANLDELAEFAGRFTELIELALGSEIEGGVGPDKIGNLFLEMLPIMTPLYETYITKHSASIARLTTLTTESPTQAMLSYIENTKAIASTHSNSWDLNSLLIKPIQRFLKYPLLLETLVASTLDDHPDKPELLRAKTAMVEASRMVNEQTQKVEICRTILQRKPLKGLSAVFSTNTPNSQQLKVKGSKSVFAVTKSKDPAISGAGTPPTLTPFDASFDPIQLENRLVEHAGGGASGLEALIKHLQGFETLIPQYVKDMVNWVRSVREALDHLEKWAAGFERVISLEETSGIEALDAFRGVIKERLGQILSGLEIAIKQTLVPTLAKIQESMKGPTLLLNTAASLRTVHNQLMNTPYTTKNNRPSPQVVEGSKTYLALMQQLRTDLPVYVRHLDRMFAYVILQVAKWQERWYREVAQAWADLWAALEVGPGSRKEFRSRRHRELTGKKAQNPTESNAPQRGAYGCSGDETAAIWWDRWEDVNNAIRALGVPSGAALQGVRSLQGLIKTAGPVAAIPTPYSAPYGSPFNSTIMYEGIEEEEDRTNRHPPGYFPAASPPLEPRHKRPPRPPLRPKINTEPSSSSYRQSMSSPVQNHAINSFLPAVSPGVDRKDKPGRGKDVSFPSPGVTTLSNGSSDNGSSIKHSPRDLEQSSSQRIRTKSHERDFGIKSVDSTDFDANHSRTVPRAPSFRKRLSENIWFGDSNSKDTGLEIDVDELEAAVATTHAREEREAVLSSLGTREQSQQATNGSLHRKPSSSLSINALRKRKTSNTTDSGVSFTRQPRPGAANRPRQVSEYGRSLNLTPIDFTGVSLFSDDAPILFTCTAVAAFHSRGLRYAGLPFLDLEIGDIVNIVKDAGRPSQHPELQPVVTDGVDTLFIGKRLPDESESAEFGWLWASFVMPLST